MDLTELSEFDKTLGIKYDHEREEDYIVELNEARIRKAVSTNNKEVLAHIMLDRTWGVAYIEGGNPRESYVRLAVKAYEYIGFDGFSSFYDTPSFRIKAFANFICQAQHFNIYVSPTYPKEITRATNAIKKARTTFLAKNGLVAILLVGLYWLTSADYRWFSTLKP